MSLPRLPVGERIRYYRGQAHRTQAAIAGLCGVTGRYLSLIENGRKTPSVDLLARLARELGVPIAALLSDEQVTGPAVAVTAAPDVARSLTGFAPSSSAEPATPAQLRERVDSAWRTWQSSPGRFTEAAAILPPLIGDVERAVHACRANGVANRRDILRVAADLYGLLRSYCRRTGRLDLSLMVADRAVRAAEDADDPVRIAAGRWNLSHVLLSHDEPSAVEQARAIALDAADQLRMTARTRKADAVRGALELVTVVADARQRRWWDARRRLRERAMPLAQQIGEGNAMWTVFGPTNVKLHAVSVEVLAGEASEGLRVADQIDPSRLPSRERRFTFGLEVARCHDLRREDAAVLVHLLSLEQLAPEDLQRSPLACNLVTGLLRRARPTHRRQIAALAGRLSLV
ncbi:MAG: helix-turn-helix domain-containing protein [Micromonosporaceae bacterium]|nr:helix-turn-helix domain-containing protein [Micromonosporaceae bacterium]